MPFYIVKKKRHKTKRKKKSKIIWERTRNDRVKNLNSWIRWFMTVKLSTRHFLLSYLLAFHSCNTKCIWMKIFNNYNKLNKIHEGETPFVEKKKKRKKEWKKLYQMRQMARFWVLRNQHPKYFMVRMIQKINENVYCFVLFFSIIIIISFFVFFFSSW